MRHRNENSLNVGFMADIAFLALVFFLVMTVKEGDTGIQARLSPHNDDIECCISCHTGRDIMRISVNSENELLVNAEYLNIKQLKTKTIEFITHPPIWENPKRVVISLQHDRATSYNTYISVYNELKAAYHEIWDKEAMKRFKFNYDDLSVYEKRAIQQDFPQIISEAEPTDFLTKR